MNSTPHDTTPKSDQDSRTFWLVAFLLFGGTMLTFWNVTQCDFINYDDDLYVTGNAWVQQGLTWKGVAWAFGWRDCVFWHPIGWLSHMVDVELFGMKAWGHHLTNLLLHAANGVLLFALLRGMTGAMWRSALVATLFALHPLRVESVAWITERKDVLSGFFGLLTLIYYARHAQAKRDSQSSGIGNYLLALCFFALGLMSKPMLMTWPILLLLLDYWPLNRLEGQPAQSAIKRLIWEKVPFFLLSAIAVTITVLQHMQAGTVVSLNQVPLATRLCSAFVAYAVYLWNFVWPVKLALPYQYSEPWPAWQVTIAAALVLELTVAAIALARRRPWLMVGWLWFVITLFPVIGIIRAGHDYIADRFTYLPSIGFLVVLVWCGGELAMKFRVRRNYLGITAGLVLAFFAVLTVRQIDHWRNTETLFRHTLAVRPGNRLALSNLSAYLLSKDGSTPEALDMLRRAMLRNGNTAAEWNNYGAALFMQKRYRDAIAAYERAVRIAPEQFEAHCNLGHALIAVGQTNHGILELKKALRYPPDDAKNLEAVWATINRLQQPDKTVEPQQKCD